VTAKKAAGHSAKHVSSAKHSGTSKHSPTAAKKAKSGTKHHVTAKAKHATHAKARAFAIGDVLPVCAFEAVAASLRLAGAVVHEDDVGQLWTLAGAREVTIADALAAAARFGLTGCRPGFAEMDAEGALGTLYTGPGSALGLRCMSSYATGFHSAPAINSGPPGDTCTLRALILGVDVPGPHAVLATADGWWSWGELWSPWPARVEEAWAVSWS